MLEYTVKAAGVEDIERLAKAVDNLEGVLSSAKGSGKSLEEVRKIIVGLKGQGSVFQELAKSIREIDPAIDKMVQGFQGMGTQVIQTLKSELQMTRAVLQTELRTLAMGVGSPLEKQLSKEIGSAIEDGTRSGVSKAKGAAAKARAEMTAAYENLVGSDGLKQLNIDELGEVKQLRELGAVVSKYHTQMLNNYEKDIARKRQLDNEWYSVTTGPGYKAMFQDFSRNLASDSTIAKSAKDSAAVFKAAFAEEAMRGKQIISNFNQMLGITKTDVAKSAKESAAVYNAAFAAEARTAQRSAMPVDRISRLDAQDMTYATAMQQMRQYYQQLEPASKATKGLAVNSATLDASFKQLAFSGNDVHSMARGLASGFNLLWLTWGNLAPLFAGAAISNGFMQTAKAGMEIAHTLEIIERLGENTGSEMVALTDRMIELGYNGPRGPKEISEAFKVLSLAGLKANDVLAVTQTVLDFSTAGTTDLQTAADVLVSVTTAFGTGAAGFERSADIIARAAADSKASVESFGEAMKTASVVGEQYGATQEDVALQIQYLAQLGIQGSSAGTAIRNMYADITGRSGQVSKLLKSLNLDFKDATGSVVPLTEQMRLLSGVLSQYDAKSQGNLLQAIFGERGAKSAVASLQAYQTAAKDSSRFSNKLEEDLARVGAAGGEAAINAAHLGQTTQKAFEAAGATFRTTMFAAFQEMEPQLYMMANAFREAFASDEAREGLITLTSTVADLGVALAENLTPLAHLAMAWGAFRLTAGAVTGALALTSAGLGQYVGMKVAATASTVAATAAERRYAAAVAEAGVANAAAGAATAGRLAALSRFIPIVGNAVAIGSAAWMLYSTYVDKAGKSAEDYYTTKSNNIIEALEKENKHLEAVNRERLTGIGLAEAEARVKAANASADIKGSYADPITKQEDIVNPLRAKYESFNSFDKAAANSVLMRLRPEEEKLNNLYKERDQQLKRLNAAEEERRKNADDAFKISLAEAQLAKQSANELVTGTKQWNLADFQGEGRGPRGPSKAQQYYDQEFEAFKKVSDAEKQIVATLYDQRKIDAEAYYDWLQFKSQETYRMEREALSNKISELAGDPKSVKAYKEAQTNLQVLDIKYTAEALKLEQERNKAIEERLTPMQQIMSAGNERLRKATTPNADLIGIERGGQFAQDASERVRIDNSYADMRLEVEKRYNREVVGLAEEGVALRAAVRDEELAQIQAFADKEYAIYQQNEAKKQLARDSYSNGVRRSYEDYMKSVTDYASHAATATTSVLRSMEDSFVNFVKTGKLGWESLANVAIEQLARIAAQQTMSGLGGLLGTIGEGVMSFFANAKGGVYDSPSLSRYSNQVHSTPKLFAFAKGAGVFGEAGPEAIMPLTRGPDGNLGVRTYGSGGSTGGGGGDVYIYMTTTVTAEGAQTTTTTAGGNDAGSKAVAQALNAKMRETIARETMQGGLIWGLVNGR